MTSNTHIKFAKEGAEGGTRTPTRRSNPPRRIAPHRIGVSPPPCWPSGPLVLRLAASRRARQGDARSEARRGRCPARIQPACLLLCSWPALVRRKSCNSLMPATRFGLKQATTTPTTAATAAHRQRHPFTSATFPTRASSSCPPSSRSPARLGRVQQAASDGAWLDLSMVGIATCAGATGRNADAG